MERKIGEIFEYHGEWYQCLKSAGCDECAFINSNCIDYPSFKCSVDDRTDNCSVIFKKLEKVGESFTCNIHGDERLVWMQEYKLYDVNFCKGNALSRVSTTRNYENNRILVFPTEEVCDQSFYSFRDLIEEAKELL